MPAHLQRKGHKEDICNEGTASCDHCQICTCQTEVDTCDGYILVSTCLCRVRRAQRSRAAKCQVPHFSAWRHSETQAGRGARVQPLQGRSMPERQTRRAFCRALSDNSTGVVRANVLLPGASRSRRLPQLASHGGGTARVAPLAVCSTWGFVRGKTGVIVEQEVKVVCRIKLSLQTQATNHLIN